MTTSPPAPGPQNEPLLTQRAVLVLLTAGFMGLVVGGLTYLSTSDVASAVLAGLACTGASTIALHQLIG
ncbi:hypothetical protein [Streptomyces sp. GbtcB6]|uniref:hypothetical protein n=1 Tax=Streptomyces sp. GbtcB6 TaxID=2824751 RepID=UPI001C308704|nr:hypothetical protein [Streptomyces sp. GbtcB6]